VRLPGLLVLVAFLLMASGIAAPGASAATGHGPRPAATPTVVTEVDYVAAALRESPDFFTDDAPRELTPSVIAAARRIVARMPVPTYLMVIDDSTDDGDVPAVIHDRLGRPGVYMETGPDGIDITAEQFGVSVQAPQAAEDISWMSPPGGGGLLWSLNRFVSDVRSGQAARIEARDYARFPNGQPEPSTSTTGATLWGMGTGVCAAALLVGAGTWLRRRHRKGRAAGRPATEGRLP
jgi:hypothetical protein